VEYDALAAAYEFTVPDAMLSPAGSVAAFASVTDGLPPGAAVLDCACGIGLFAVGLAEAGCEVCATDVSPSMVARTRALAADRGTAIDARVCSWQQLGDQGWQERFDAVFCVGNALTHAPGQDGRRAALLGMAGVLRRSGMVVLTSRNWERRRDQPPGLSVGEKVIERSGRRGLLVYDWLPAAAWTERHHVDVAVVLLDAGGDGVETYAERLAYWPFTHEELTDDLQAAGLRLAMTTYHREAERYLVTATRTPSAASGDST
jgi:SAM-dependent methyltransferase